MTPDVPQTFVHTPEYALVLAILHQAYVDLRDTAPAQERANSRAFFGNERRHLEWLCDLAHLDHTGIQDAVRRQYPHETLHHSQAQELEGIEGAPAAPLAANRACTKLS